MDNISFQIRQCIDLIRSGSTEGANEATQLLIGYYFNPFAIDVLLNIFTKFTLPRDRQFIIIGMCHCVNQSWDIYDQETKDQLFSNFLNLLKLENDPINKNNIIHLIQITTAQSFYSILIHFAKSLAESENSADLETCLILSTLIDLSQLPLDESAMVRDFIFSTLDTGFSSSSKETRLAALHHLLYSPVLDLSFIQEKIPIYWHNSLEILQPYFVEKTNFKRVVYLFNYAIISQKFPVDIVPLMGIILSLAKQNEVDFENLLCIAQILEAMCVNYAQIVVESDFLNNLIETMISISVVFFEPNDSLVISQAGCFERAFTSICVNIDLLNYLYQIFSSLDAIDAHHFIIVKSLGSLFKCSREFFLDKLSDVADVLIGGMNSESLLLVEASVCAAEEYLEYFSSDCDEINYNMMSSIMNAVCRAKTVDIINTFSNTLEMFKQSDDYFENAFQILVDILSNSEPILQQSAVMCLGVLARFSSVKISQHLEEFISVMFEILGSNQEIADLLRPRAVECLHIAADNVGSEFDSYAQQFLEFVVNNLGSDSNDLALTCFSALELITEKYPDVFQSVVNDIIILTLDKASTDVTPQFKKAVAEQLGAEGLEVEEEFTPLFKESEIALRVLSSIIKVSPEMCHRFRMHTLQCCKIQCHSANADCRAAAAFAISNLADTLASPNSEPPVNETTQMGHVLLALIPPPEENPNIKEAAYSFIAAAHMVDILEYHVFGICTRPLIECAKNYIKFISSDRELIVSYSQTVDAISRFISMVSGSSGKMAPTVLQDFFPVASELVNSSEPLMRSFAFRFMSDVILTASNFLDLEFKQNWLYSAMSIASQEIEDTAFVCIRVIAEKDPELIEPVFGEIYQICLEKLNVPVQKTDRFYMMRDNCVVTLGYLAMKIFNDRIEIKEYIIPCLTSLPIVMDYELVHDSTNFFFWLYQRAGSEYSEYFLQILIIVFGVPPHTFLQMMIPDSMLLEMKNLCITLLSSHQNQNEVISLYLEGDEDKIRYFADRMNQDNVIVQ